MTLKVVLALLQAAILAAGLALLGALIVESFERSLRDDADDLLSARADAAEAVVRASTLARPDTTSPTSLDLDLPAFNAFSAPGVLFEVSDGEGRLIAASPGLPTGGLPWSPAAREAVDHGRASLDSVPTDTGQRVRVLSRAVVEDGQRIAIVRVGESLQPIDHALRDLFRPLLVGGILVLLACIVVTWQVVSFAFEPLETIAETAEHIASTGSISQAVRPEGTQEARQLATSFNRMIERLRHLLESQRQLLADTSHELRNPLTVIRTDLDLLGRDLDPETRQEVAAEAQDEAERMSRLVADLLYLSREEQAEHEPRELVQLDALVADVIERLRQVAPDHTVEVGHADTVTVPGNADRLRQLVTNLVENAIRYSPAGGHVTVDLRLLSANLARLDVKDDGIGIAPEHLPRVFDRFYRVDPARARNTGGSGLGLAIVKRVAESYGGTVGAASTPGVGSTFSVTLPAATSLDPATPPRSDLGGSGLHGSTDVSLTPSGPAPTPRGPDLQADPAARPSERAAGSPPAGTPPTTDRQAPRR
jgi:two-component system sensor histidine kinase MprB